VLRQGLKSANGFTVRRAQILLLRAYPNNWYTERYERANNKQTTTSTHAQ